MAKRVQDALLREGRNQFIELPSPEIGEEDWAGVPTDNVNSVSVDFDTCGES